jgi:hypothetical protein
MPDSALNRRSEALGARAELTTPIKLSQEPIFGARIRNLNTREAYARACSQFLTWCENHVDDLRLITPMHVAAYMEQHPGSPQTIKQHLAAIKNALRLSGNQPDRST